MTEPFVTAMCLTADRQKFTERALRCFFSQTYENKRILILDTGTVPFQLPKEFEKPGVMLHQTPRKPGSTIGSLRNDAMRIIGGGGLICHWDSDDFYAPGRIQEQVQFMGGRTSVVGIRSVLFWDAVAREAWRFEHPNPRYCVGTTLLYDPYVAHRFPEKNSGEDTAWQKNYQGRESMPWLGDRIEDQLVIATIHAGNHGTYTDNRAPEWKRMPSLDADCERIMEL